MGNSLNNFHQLINDSTLRLFSSTSYAAYLPLFVLKINTLGIQQDSNSWLLKTMSPERPTTPWQKKTIRYSLNFFKNCKKTQKLNKEEDLLRIFWRRILKFLKKKIRARFSFWRLLLSPSSWRSWECPRSRTWKKFLKNLNNWTWICSFSSTSLPLAGH